MARHGITDRPSPAVKRAMVIVSRVFGIYPWRHRHADDPAWFERRMHLLQRITLPALSRVQVPFVWVWQAHWTKMDLVAAHMAEIDLHGIDVRLVDQRAKTHDEISPDAEKFLTFRIDTDDAWLPSALDSAADETFDDQTLVNFPRGVTLDWASGEMRHRNRSHTKGPSLRLLKTET